MQRYPDGLKKVTNAAAEATEAGIKGAIRTITGEPDLVRDLTHEATIQAVVGVQEAIASPIVNSTLQLAGFDAAAAMTDGAMKAVGAQASAAPDNIKATVLQKLAGLLGGVSGRSQTQKR